MPLGHCFGVPETATKDGADDAALRFITKVRELAPGKQIILIWMTKCEELDLPAAKAPTGKSTGLCGNIPCATGTCPRAFAKQLKTLMDSHAGPLGLLTIQQACERDAKFYGGPAGWIPASVDYLDDTPLAPTKRGVPHDQLWLVVQGAPKNHNTEATARAEALKLRPGAVIVVRVPFDQSYEPAWSRLINWKSKVAERPVQYAIHRDQRPETGSEQRIPQYSVQYHLAKVESLDETIGQFPDCSISQKIRRPPDARQF